MSAHNAMTQAILLALRAKEEELGTPNSLSALQFPIRAREELVRAGLLQAFQNYRGRFVCLTPEGRELAGRFDQ